MILAEIADDTVGHRPNGTEMKYDADRHHRIVVFGAPSPMIYDAEVGAVELLG